MIKKTILSLCFLALCLLGIFSYVSYRSFNTEAFKEQIIQAVQTVTGRTLTIKGNYKLVWNPLPTMTLEQTTLSNIANSPNPDMFNAEKIQIQIEWSSLFSSPIRIKNVIIVKPRILIERISRSTTNLQFPILLAARDVLDTDITLEGQSSAKIDNIQIEDGELRYVNQIYKTTHILSDINGNLTMGALNGPFGFEGTANFNNIPFKIKSSLGAHEVAQTIDFITDISLSDTTAHLKIDAKFNSENPDSYLNGTLAFDIADPNTLLANLKKPLLPKKYNTTTIGSAGIELGSTKTVLSDFILKIGNDDEAFTVDASYVRESTSQPGQMTLNITSLNMDEWLETLQALIKQKIPENFDCNFNATIPQVTWHQQVGTTLNLVGEIADKQIYVTEGSILLPGSTTVQMSGRLAPEEDNLIVLAQLDLQSQNLSAVLPFFNPPENKITKALQKVQKAELKASLEWSPNGFNLEIPALSLNDATGVAHVSKQSNTSEVVLELANIDLNSYITKTNDKPVPINQVLESLFALLKNTQPPELNTHWEFVFDNAQWEKTKFKNITLLTNTNQKDATIEAIATTKTQDSLVLKTDIQNLGTPDWTFKQNKFEIKTKELNDLLKALNITTDNKWVQDIHQLDAIGEIRGNQKDWQIDVATQTQTMNVNIEGAIANNQPSNLGVRFQHNSIPHFFVKVWDKNPFPNLGGKLEMEAFITQNNQLLSLSKLQLKADSKKFTGDASYDLKTKEWKANLNGDTIDLQKILPDMGRIYLNATGFDPNPFDFSFLKNVKGSINLKANEAVYQTMRFKRAVLNAHIDDDTLHIDNFSSTNDTRPSAVVKAKGSLNWIKTPTFNFQLTTQNLPISESFAIFDGVGLTKGKLTSEWNLSSSGETPLQMARTLTGNGKVQLSNSTWVGADLTALLNTIQKTPLQEVSTELLSSRFKHALSNGSTDLAIIKGNFTIKDGMFQIPTAVIESENATTDSATISWDIPTSTIQAKVPFYLREYASFPSIIFKFSKEYRGVSYSADTTAFITALMTELEQEKTKKQEEEQKAQQEVQARELEEAKTTALSVFQKLEKQLDFWPQQVVDIPDIPTQKVVLNAHNFREKAEQLFQNPNTTQAQYQQLASQIEGALSDLDNAKIALTDKQKDLMREKGESTLEQAQSFISKINELYQKRPSLSILTDLLQRSEEQRNIIKRAIAQYNKPLTFEQTNQVSAIINDAYNKIVKAYNYAEQIYSGRQSPLNNSNIRRVDL